jgi:hypothetical protein
MIVDRGTCLKQGHRVRTSIRDDRIICGF